jgi:hypothetical protein
MRASQQHQQSTPRLVEIDWHGVLGGIIFFVLFTAVGPITLLLGWLIRAWCKRSIFDARDRWDSVRAFAWCFGILFALFLAFAIIAFTVFPGPSLHLWTHSPLHFLGAPNLLDNIWLRWTLSFPLAFAVALSMGWGETRLVRRFTRVPTEREQRQMAEKRRREQEEQVRREQQAERERTARLAKAAKRATYVAAKSARATLTASASPPENTTPRSTSLPMQPSGATITPATGQGKPTLWDELPGSHPWKQEAKREQNQPPQQGQETSSVEPTSPVKKVKPKPPDLGDGSMDALL